MPERYIIVGYAYDEVSFWRGGSTLSASRVVSETMRADGYNTQTIDTRTGRTAWGVPRGEADRGWEEIRTYTPV